MHSAGPKQRKQVAVFSGQVCKKAPNSRGNHCYVGESVLDIVYCCYAVEITLELRIFSQKDLGQLVLCLGLFPNCERIKKYRKGRHALGPTGCHVC